LEILTLIMCLIILRVESMIYQFSTNPLYSVLFGRMTQREKWREIGSYDWLQFKERWRFAIWTVLSGYKKWEGIVKKGRKWTLLQFN